MSRSSLKGGARRGSAKAGAGRCCVPKKRKSDGSDGSDKSDRSDGRSGRHAGGRPTDYRAEYAEQGYNYCILGATDRQLAEFFGVSTVTINGWKHAHPEFLNSIKRGKLVADAEVAKSLYARANGYSHEAEKLFPPTKDREAERLTYVEHYPPDTAACIFWLKNRQPGLWREKHEVEHSGPDGGAIAVAELDPAQIRAELARRGALPEGLGELPQKCAEDAKS